MSPKKIYLGHVVAWLALYADGRHVGYRPLREMPDGGGGPVG